MSRKRNLEKELGITQKGNNTPHIIDTARVKHKVQFFLSAKDNERKITHMKSTRRTAIIAAAVVLVLGFSAFAATRLLVHTWRSSSSGIPEYTSVPTQEAVKEDIGYDVVIVEEFSNGYKFDNGSVVSNDLRDENNNSLEKFKSVSFRYEKDGDRVNFSQDKYNSETAMAGKVIETVGDIDIYSSGYTSKIVPPGYKYTDEDKAAMESGELIFSEGSQTVEIHDVKAVSWVVADMHYNLMQINGKLTVDELAEMAKEIISKYSK